MLQSLELSQDLIDLFLVFTELAYVIIGLRIGTLEFTVQIFILLDDVIEIGLNGLVVFY